MSRKLRCGECGSNSFSFKNILGQRFSFKSFPAVELTENLELNVCNICENTIFLQGDAKKLDAALESSVQRRSSHFIESILSSTGWRQNEMGDFLGFTPVYISDVKKGKRVPEFKTFNYLKVLSECEGAVECVVSDDERCSLGHRYLLGTTVQPRVSATATTFIEDIDENYNFAIAA